MRSSFALLCVLAVAFTGCSETVGASGTASNGGSAGDGGRGGSAGVGGFGGAGGGGEAGAAGAPGVCEPTNDRCSSGTPEPYEACCEQLVPEQPNACAGTESTENPTTCALTGSEVFYRLTLMEVEDDCNAGYDLDGCDGTSCRPYRLTPAEGLSGVDNALAGIGAIFEDVGGNLGPLNKAFSDSLCGLTEGRTCDGGEDDGDQCARDEDCVGADARCVTGDCRHEIAMTPTRLLIDANPAEACANVTVQADGGSSAHILNLSEDGCLSGRLGVFPIPLPWEDGLLENTVVRMTLSSAGFSHGRLGGTMGADTATAVREQIIEAAAPIYLFDINESIPPTINPTAACNALSATLRIGGIAE